MTDKQVRMVPVNARDLDALRYVLNRADEASRIRTVMSTFTLPERETTAERLERLYATLKAAAPAVQPDREVIERLTKFANSLTGEFSSVVIPAKVAKQAAEDIRAALTVQKEEG